MVVDVQNLSKSYSGKSVFKDISFRLPVGSTTLITGPSGCGKTTLLHILLGLEEADSGSIRGLELMRPTVVFQEDRLCKNLHALANVRFVAPHQRDPVIANVLKEMQLPEEALHQPIREYSGGMKRRVAIARALLAPGNFLVMDEPLRGLDDDTRQAVLRVIHAHRADRTLLIISHDKRDSDDFKPDQIISFPVA